MLLNDILGVFFFILLISQLVFFALILGFVGAGGLGQILYYELSLLHEPQAATVMMAMFGLVMIVDAISAKMRRLQIHEAG